MAKRRIIILSSILALAIIGFVVISQFWFKADIIAPTNVKNTATVSSGGEVLDTSTVNIQINQ